MSANNQSKKKSGGQSHTQKETKSLKFKGGRGGDFRIGSRDILSTPEIRSPFDYEEETPKSRRGKKNQLTPAEEKPVAPTHNRKSKKKAEEPASEIKVTRAKADKAPAKKTAKTEPPKKGCGGVVSIPAATLLASLLGVAFVARKKDE